MTDRNAVWAAAYGAFCATRAATRAQMFIDPPDASWWEKVKTDARTFASAAVEDLEEQKRDESRDVWITGAFRHGEENAVEGWDNDDHGGERYVPHSQLVASQRMLQSSLTLNERHLELIAQMQRDSELLDAILDTVTAMRRCPFAEIDRHGKRLDNAINRAIAERGKR